MCFLTKSKIYVCFRTCRLLSQKLLPPTNVFPTSRDEAKKMISKLGLDYNMIHACPNDCILYRGEYESKERCPKCETPRYKDASGKIPHKVLRHFPLAPRIKYMFRTPELARLMDWGAKNVSTDGIMRVPSDCLAFKHINSKWPEFEQEPRYIKMGVGLDGVNPFSMRSSRWSTWPVVLINYNLPPFICFKKEHLILSLIIPGKRQVKDLNVYLAPLIDDLLELWRGIDVLDMSKQDYDRKFRVRGILAWTIHDFPGYGFCAGMLS